MPFTSMDVLSDTYQGRLLQSGLGCTYTPSTSSLWQQKVEQIYLD